MLQRRLCSVLRHGTGIMTIFKDTSEFEEFLRGLNPDYEQYAKALWTHGVTSTSQLGNASPPTLLACGVERFIHAEDIVAQSKALGKSTRADGDYCISCKLPHLLC